MKIFDTVLTPEQLKEAKSSNMVELRETGKNQATTTRILTTAPPLKIFNHYSFPGVTRFCWAGKTVSVPDESRLTQFCLPGKTVLVPPQSRLCLPAKIVSRWHFNTTSLTKTKSYCELPQTVPSNLCFYL